MWYAWYSVRNGPGASGSTQRPGQWAVGKEHYSYRYWQLRPVRGGRAATRDLWVGYLLPRCSCSALLQRATLLLALPRPLGHRHSILQGSLLPAGPGATYCMLLQVCIYRQHPNLLQPPLDNPTRSRATGQEEKETPALSPPGRQRQTPTTATTSTTTTRIPGRAALRGPPSPGSPGSHFSPFVSPAHVFAPGSRPGTPSDRRRVD